MHEPRLADWRPTPETPAGRRNLKPRWGAHTWNPGWGSPGAEASCPIHRPKAADQLAVPATQAQSNRSADQQPGWWLVTTPKSTGSEQLLHSPCAWAGASAALVSAGPRDLIVLNHSSYSQIFRCPLYLVSDLHIYWNTIGCSFCSSDQLRVSLVLRGSGLFPHLSHCHLPPSPILCFKYNYILSSPTFIRFWGSR